MRHRIPRVLIVEDNIDIARLVRLNLRDLPAEITICSDGPSGLAHAQSASFDLLVLDIALPGISGVQLLEQARAAGCTTPALMLTGQLPPNTSSLGALGPIEWMQKPFGVRDLIERAQGMLRTDAGSADHTPIEQGPLRIDLAARLATLAGSTLSLEAKEFDLLVLLAREPGRVFTRRELRQQLWGESSEIGEHVVNAMISKLRAQLESDPRAPSWIRPGPSGGYQLGGVARE